MAKYGYHNGEKYWNVRDGEGKFSEGAGSLISKIMKITDLKLPSIEGNYTPLEKKNLRSKRRKVGQKMLDMGHSPESVKATLSKAPETWPEVKDVKAPTTTAPAEEPKKTPAPAATKTPEEEAQDLIKEVVKVANEDGITFQEALDSTVPQSEIKKLKEYVANNPVGHSASILKALGPEPSEAPEVTELKSKLDGLETKDLDQGDQNMVANMKKLLGQSDITGGEISTVKGAVSGLEEKYGEATPSLNDLKLKAISLFGTPETAENKAKLIELSKEIDKPSPDLQKIEKGLNDLEEAIDNEPASSDLPSGDDEIVEDLHDALGHLANEPTVTEEQVKKALEDAGLADAPLADAIDMLADAGVEVTKSPGPKSFDDIVKGDKLTYDANGETVEVEVVKKGGSNKLGSWLTVKLPGSSTEIKVTEKNNGDLFKALTEGTEVTPSAEPTQAGVVKTTPTDKVLGESSKYKLTGKPQEVTVDGEVIGYLSKGKVGGPVMNGKINVGWQAESSGWLIFNKNGSRIQGQSLTEATKADALAALQTKTSPKVETPAPTSEVPDVNDFSQWKKVGGQKGSNAGGTYEDPSGKQHYVKTLKTADHASSEVLANALYNKLGVDAPKVAKVGEGNQVASPLVEGAVSNLSTKLSNAAYKKQVQDGFAVDAWLANWDVAGLSLDNIVTDASGKPVRIDNGGALDYRAQGTKKGSAFGNEVGEFHTLRDGTNPQAAKLFGDMTNQQIKDSVAKLDAITDADIDSMVAEAYGKPNKALADKLKARKADIKSKAAALDTPQSAPAASNQPTLDDLEAMLNSKPKGLAQSLSILKTQVKAKTAAGQYAQISTWTDESDPASLKAAAEEINSKSKKGVPASLKNWASVVANTQPGNSPTDNLQKVLDLTKPAPGKFGAFDIYGKKPNGSYKFNQLLNTWPEEDQQKLAKHIQEAQFNGPWGGKNNQLAKWAAAKLGVEAPSAASVLKPSSSGELGKKVKSLNNLKATVGSGADFNSKLNSWVHKTSPDFVKAAADHVNDNPSLATNPELYTWAKAVQEFTPEPGYYAKLKAKLAEGNGLSSNKPVKGNSDAAKAVNANVFHVLNSWPKEDQHKLAELIKNDPNIASKPADKEGALSTWSKLYNTGVTQPESNKLNGIDPDAKPSTYSAQAGGGMGGMGSSWGGSDFKEAKAKLTSSAHKQAYDKLSSAEKIGLAALGNDPEIGKLLEKDHSSTPWAEAKNVPAYNAGGINAGQKSTLVSYTGSAHATINGALRTGKGMSDGSTTAAKVKKLDSFFANEAISLKEDVTLVRGISADKHVAAAFGLQGNDLGYSPQNLLKHADKVVGRTFADKGFLSTSMQDSQQSNGVKGFTSSSKINLRILAPKGTKAANIKPISNYSHENEVLVDRGAKMVVTDIYELNGKVWVDTVLVSTNQTEKGAQ